MRRLAFALVTITLGACGLSVTGLALNDDEITAPEGGAPDAIKGDTGTETETETGTTSPPDATSEAGEPDASITADAALDASLDPSDADAATPDASVEAGKLDAGGFDAGAGCTLLLDENFSAPLVSWQPAGSAPGLDTGAKLYRLTNKGDDTVARALWYTQPLTFTGVLRARVEFVLDPTSTNGTGISLVWGASNNFGVGGSSLGLGICGNNIFGVAAQYRFETGRVYSVVSTNGSCGTNGFQSVQAGNAGTIQLTLTPTTVTGQVDLVADSARAATFAKTGYIGITASTDNAGRSGIAIKSVRVVSCDP